MGVRIKLINKSGRIRIPLILFQGNHSIRMNRMEKNYMKKEMDFMENNLAIQKFQVKITVIKKIFNEEFIAECAANPDKWTECTHFKIGDSFITDLEQPWGMPEGFCGWAWADIQRTVYGMARGGQDVFLTCCTDGYRPVIFKLEKV